MLLSSVAQSREAASEGLRDMDIIVTGNPVDGYTFHGPFTDTDTALAWAERCGESWWLAVLDKPEAPPVAVRLRRNGLANA